MMSHVPDTQTDEATAATPDVEASTGAAPAEMSAGAATADGDGSPAGDTTAHARPGDWPADRDRRGTTWAEAPTPPEAAIGPADATDGSWPALRVTPGIPRPTAAEPTTPAAPRQTAADWPIDRGDDVEPDVTAEASDAPAGTVGVAAVVDVDRPAPAASDSIDTHPVDTQPVATHPVDTHPVDTRAPIEPAPDAVAAGPTPGVTAWPRVERATETADGPATEVVEADPPALASPTVEVTAWPRDDRAAETTDAPATERPADQEPYSTARLVAGIVGRMWLSFLAGALLVTIVPLLFGWRPYVVETGSMEPRIRTGDVVLVSPQDDPEILLGRVVAFERPDDPESVTIHRVIGINDDGSYTTQGDANQSPDSEAVPADHVVGMGRLLVKWAGLPLLWLQRGAWFQLLAFMASIAMAVYAVVRDDEDEIDEPDDPEDPDGGSGRTLDDTRSEPAETTVSDWPNVRPEPAPEVPEVPQPESPPVPALEPAPVRSSTGTGVARFLAAAAAITVALGVPSTAAAAFTGATNSTGNQWASPNLDYATEINARAPYLYWKLDETGGTVAADSSGNGRTGTYSPGASGFDFLADGALVTDTPDRAVSLTNNNSCIHTTSAASINAPQVFTVIAWFRAPTNYSFGGKLIGFERPQTGVAAPSAGNYDRQLYVDGNGRLWFTVYNGTHVALSTPGSLTDGAWHMAVGTQDGSGMKLYVDGVLVDSNGNTAAETTIGWWRAGCGNLAGWGDQWTGPRNPGTNADTPRNRVFRADLDELTVYMGTALTPEDVAVLYYAR